MPDTTSPEWSADALKVHVDVLERRIRRQDGEIEDAQRRFADLMAHVETLREAIRDHRAVKADDRCIEDDDALYAALGDGIKCDRRVGDKAAMLLNCARYISRRCEGGGWPSYAELEKQLADLTAWKESAVAAMAKSEVLHGILRPFSRYLGWDVYDAMCDYVATLERDAKTADGALANCYMMAKREIARIRNTGEPNGRDAVALERWQHVQRFCEETGLTSSVLRDAVPTEITQG